MTSINRKHRRMFESMNRKQLAGLEFPKRQHQMKGELNQDDDLQPRYITNLNNFEIKISPNPTFENYLLSRIRKPVVETIIKPFSYEHFDHAYFNISNKDEKEMQIRQSFDFDDVEETLKAYRKGV